MGRCHNTCRDGASRVGARRETVYGAADKVESVPVESVPGMKSCIVGEGR